MAFLPCLTDPLMFFFHLTCFCGRAGAFRGRVSRTLQAPVPFLVGVHSRYLEETSSDRRPEGVVFVDLDNDSIYLGLDEDM